jgi:hypothetical protein
MIQRMILTRSNADHASARLKRATAAFRHRPGRLLVACLCLLGWGWSAACAADGRLLGVTGLSSLDGSTGGGMTSWALLAGYAERDEFGLSAAASVVRTGDFDVTALAAAANWSNRLELSLASQRLDLDSLVEQGTTSQADLRLDTLGLKWRLAGDPIYDPRGQFSVGLQYKRNADFELARQAGAERNHGVDLYLAWSRVWLDGPWHRPLLINGTLRASQAHQTGFLGFDRDHRLNAEGAVGLFLSRHWLIGAEYRNKPDRLPFAAEDDWADIFLAWFPNKRWQVALAWLDLGEIGGVEGQRGAYLTVQGR